VVMYAVCVPANLSDHLTQVVLQLLARTGLKLVMPGLGTEMR